MAKKKTAVKKHAKKKPAKKVINAKEPKKKKTATTKDEGWTPKRKANWSAGERPQCCKHCKSTNSSVTSTPDMKRYNPPRTIRYRICDDCGRRFTTIDCDYGK